MGEHEGLAVTCISARATLHLKSWVLARSAPITLPPSVTQHCRLITVAPGEWLLISDAVDEQTLHEVARDFHNQGVAAVSVAQGLAAIEIKGRAAHDVLAKSCGLDLHPVRFPVGSCTRTRLAKLPVIVDYVDGKPIFDLYVARSYLPYLFSWLNDAAVEFMVPAQTARHT